MTSRKMSFFGGNPLATPVGQKIEQATSDSLPSEDWGLNLEVCDLINEAEDGPRDAIKAIRKRLQSHPKNYTVVMYTLTVLESCVKNCGKRFHLFACSKDFVHELVKLIGPKNEPPAAVQEKVLSLIQSWSDAFRHQPELAGVSQVYAELKHKGVDFPMTNLDTMAPIITPQRTCAPEPRPTRQNSGTTTSPPRRPAAPHPGGGPGGGGGGGGGGPPPLSSAPTQTTSSGPVNLSAEQRAKLHSELDVVESNSKVLGEMLAELSPGKEHQDDIQLLQELHGSCRAMQQRVVELVGRVSDDLLTADLLRINDDLNNLFLRYDRHMSKVKGGVASPTRSPPTPQQQQQGLPLPPPPPQRQPQPEVTLIDLADDPPSAQLAELAVNHSMHPPLHASTNLAILQPNTYTPPVPPYPITTAARLSASQELILAMLQPAVGSPPKAKKNEDADFDMFAQSRTATYETTKTSGSTYQDNSEADFSPASLATTAQHRTNPQQRDTDFDEMEAWLNEHPNEGQAGEGGAKEETISSSEFDRFLAERAAAADTLPTIPAATGSSGAPPRQRTMARDDKDNQMFAL